MGDRERRIANAASRQGRTNEDRADRAARLLGVDAGLPTIGAISTALGDLMADALHLAQRAEAQNRALDFEALAESAWDAFELERARSQESFVARQDFRPEGDSLSVAPPEDPEAGR